ncbi:hypothetical protein A2625_02780 [candidate division WOR-1 bacterium RIFCSPHIGHO2_01_FULL_53_15]|uniref:DUF362 domain-containing protein n=1 Tax=candidate division WOR-1 bacterium RIFCSPHIGHO2_01_FULL_53_15 TaxID=1802564 RepID=A0A1F4Q2F6_UNCSA|nr:MAG: hypothetical protein A2625_02780 [candidate division WOR-1 bacterium RIFCSPHIGHO2_01_FULL_53_15]OGC10355.1 MAG: hypothetical protein A3D23_07470 [candidate division WOR-1 bacterium RIFCSPHIGHO2_02_FULL_53_26]
MRAVSKVYFTKDISQAATLFDLAGLDKLISPNDSVALKIHFGEPGNTAYLKPERVMPVFEKITALGGKPFFTDCNTLYKGPRGKTKEHLQTAKDHGYANVTIPEENDCEQVEVRLKHFRNIFLGGTARTKTIVALTHFKGHELTGFGGTLKNLGMGFATRLGKLKQHQDCKACAELKACKKNLTIEACWIGSSTIVQEKMVEYAFGALKGKKAGFINFITDVSPNCDCFAHNGPPVVPDIGVLASTDPVALDQASIDLVNQAAGRDVLRELYPEADWSVQLIYAESLGLGSRGYELVVI